jgi:hypothetical protein
MRGQAPTSTQLAGPAGTLAKPLPANEFPVTGRPKRPAHGCDARLFDSRRRALVGGKDHGGGDVPWFRYEMRGRPKSLEDMATNGREREEVLYPFRVDGTCGPTGPTLRPGVGKPLPAVGVSPRNPRSLAEQR